MIKKKVQMEGIIENETLRIPVLDLFIKEAIQRAKKEMFDYFRELLNEHRKVFYVGCEENCFCFDIDSELMKEEQRHLSNSEPKGSTQNNNFTAHSDSPKVCPCGHKYSKHNEQGCQVVHSEGDCDVYCECEEQYIKALFG